MSDETKHENETKEQVEELGEEELGQVAGGTMRGNVVTVKTTDISDDTRKRI